MANVLGPTIVMVWIESIDVLGGVGQQPVGYLPVGEVSLALGIRGGSGLAGALPGAGDETIPVGTPFLPASAELGQRQVPGQVGAGQPQRLLPIRGEGDAVTDNPAVGHAGFDEDPGAAQRSREGCLGDRGGRRRPDPVGQFPASGLASSAVGAFNLK